MNQKSLTTTLQIKIHTFIITYVYYRTPKGLLRGIKRGTYHIARANCIREEAEIRNQVTVTQHRNGIITYLRIDISQDCTENRNQSLIKFNLPSSLEAVILFTFHKGGWNQTLLWIPWLKYICVGFILIFSSLYFHNEPRRRWEAVNKDLWFVLLRAGRN